MKIKIVVADDHPLVVSGLYHILANHADMKITGAYSNGAELLKSLSQHIPDVLLLDIHMPVQSGDELAEIIRKQYPHVKIIVLTNNDDIIYIMAMFRKGVKGYLLKTMREDILAGAIREVYSGGQYLDASLNEKVMQYAARVKNKDNEEIILTLREKQVLEYVAADLTSAQIAEKMNLSKRTIDSHRHSLLTKLKVEHTAALIKKASELDLL